MNIPVPLKYFLTCYFSSLCEMLLIPQNSIQMSLMKSNSSLPTQIPHPPCSHSPLTVIIYVCVWVLAQCLFLTLDSKPQRGLRLCLSAHHFLPSN